MVPARFAPASAQGRCLTLPAIVDVGVENLPQAHSRGGGLYFAMENETVDELRLQNQALIELSAIATRSRQSLDDNQMLADILTRMLQWVDADAGAIALLDSAGAPQPPAALQGMTPEQPARRPSSAPDDGIVAQTVRSGEVTLAPAADGATRDPDALTLGAACPLKANDRVVGILTLYRSGGRPFAPRDARLLATCGLVIGMYVEHARFTRDASELAVLREIDRLRSQLLANVSHELRTPLGLIKVFGSMLIAKDMDFDRAARLEFLNAISSEADRLQQIVDNLLDLARVQDQRLRLTRAPVNLGHLVAEVIQGICVQSTPHRVVCDLPAQPLVAVADRQRIIQVLRNLLGNACKYSPGGGTIRVAGREDKSHVVMQISDEGIGIPADELDRIFERFYRVESQATEKIDGLGLGLAISRAIVEAHGGRIWAESVLGAGSSFFFTLPVGEPAAAETGACAGDQWPAPEGQSHAGA